MPIKIFKLVFTDELTFSKPRTKGGLLYFDTVSHVFLLVYPLKEFPLIIYLKHLTFKKGYFFHDLFTLSDWFLNYEHTFLLSCKFYFLSVHVSSETISRVIMPYTQISD